MLNRTFLIMLIAGAILAGAASAADWPTYRHDNSRSCVTPEELKLPLTEQWALTPPGVPTPAWADPHAEPVEGHLELPATRFDDAYHVTVADGIAYFGTSANNKIYAVDVTSGKVRWSFFTGGPVRLAPAIHNGRAYFGADDGYIYCLDAANGSVVWKVRVAPNDERVLARGRMISLWPPRTGVLVDDGIAYCSAGVFPGERVYLYALRAEDGSRVWANSKVSDRGAGQHGFSPQGYLLASKTSLFVPSGRALPACFNKENGKFVYQKGYSRWTYRTMSGTSALLAGDHLFTGNTQVIGYDQKSGNIGFAWFAGRRLVVTADTSYMLDDSGIQALDRATYPELSNKRRNLAAKRSGLAKQKPETDEEKAKLAEQVKAVEEEQKAVSAALEGCAGWRFAQKELDSMIVTQNLVVTGGSNAVAALNKATGEQAWSAPVNGIARELSVSDGRLFVSTDQGTVHCFGEGAGPGDVSPTANSTPYPADELTPIYEAAAEAIIEQTGLTRGFCLVLGCGTGRLAYELAKRTELMVYGLDPDAENVDTARTVLDSAGLYGTRISVDQGGLMDLPYSDYCANLIVSDDALTTGRLRASAREAMRCLKPVGGTICLGQTPEAAKAGKPLSADTLRDWLNDTGDPAAHVTTDRGTWGMLVRGRLPGAGSWTHQYGDPGNTASSTDQVLRCPLGVLWYGEPGPAEVPSRHAGNAAPLSINGRVYLEGINRIICFDAYNGLEYWRREIPGAYRVGMVREASNIAAIEDSIFVATPEQCLRLDAETGDTRATYDLPPAKDGAERKWAYLATADGLLFGSTMAKSQHSDSVFGLDIDGGDIVWQHHGTSIRNNTIAISDGRVLFADDGATPEQRREALGDKIDELMKRKNIDAAAAEQELKSADIRVAVALDMKTGDVLWEKPVDLTDCGGHVLSAIATKGVLLFCGSHYNGHYWPQFLGGEYGARRVVAVSAEDGSSLWSKPIGYRIRPLVVGDTLYAEPWAFDLRTGEQKMREHPFTGRTAQWQFERPGHHCGTISGSPNGLYFRSGSIAYYDLAGDFGTTHFAGQRPGCWINLIPANGLLLAPEASSGCTCLYSIHCTVVFKPDTVTKAWGVFNAPGEQTPVKQMAVNLGAPGDRSDNEGKVWLGYPRPGGRMILKFDLGVETLPDCGYYSFAAEHTDVGGTDAPWLYSSGCGGFKKCTIPLTEEGEGAAVYTVRLAFADLHNEQPGERVFDIKIQDEVVAEDFDIAREAGGAKKAVVREYADIEVLDNLSIEFVPKSDQPPQDKAPLLSAFEVVRTKVLQVGLATPSFLLSDLDREVKGEVTVANNRDEDFAGTLQLTAPQGFSVTPTEQQVRLASGEKLTVPIMASVAQKGDPGDFQIAVKLARADGATEAEKIAPLEYLGPRGRVVVKAAEDSYASNRSQAQNYGHEANILVDGGDQKMGDQSHNIGYLKFPVDIPGKSASVTLRIHVSATGHAQSVDSGTIHLPDGAWEEYKLDYAHRPKPGRRVGTLGKVDNNVWVERKLDVELEGKTELSLVLEPTSCDGATYYAREGGHPPELVIEYIPAD